MKIWASILILVSSPLWGDDTYAYKVKAGGYLPVCDNSMVEIANLPPVLDQGNYGVCYAHSSILLLEHLRCSQKASPTSCYEERGSVLHLARFDDSASEEVIQIGGTSAHVLTRFQTVRKLAKDSCAKYEDWDKLDQLYKDQVAEANKNKPSNVLSEEVDFFYYVNDRLNNNASQDEINCWANDIVKAGLNHNLQEVLNILNQAKNRSWEELRYKVLVPQKCKNDPVTYPHYSIDFYPIRVGAETSKGFRDYIFKTLSAGVPTEISFCTGSGFKYLCSPGQIQNGTCPANYATSEDQVCPSHSATVVGQRHVCDTTKCELQYKVQNSYGKSWQVSFDEGWVNADHLISKMKNSKSILPEGKSADPTLTGPYYSNSPVRSHLKTKRMDNGKKCWDASAGEVSETQSDVLVPMSPIEPSVPNVPETKPQDVPVSRPVDELVEVKPAKRTMYLCKGGLLTDIPRPNMGCKPR